ncbi:MAG: ABC transporter substrate-binding protein [Actinomycetota bacterium]|nr:ABC transporter substrate-binding protein [Actinomycetota bacterium]
MTARRYPLAAVFAGCVTLLVGCSSQAPAPAPATPAPNGAATTAGFPLEITNCGQSQRFDGSPTKAVSLDQITTELMLHLNLGQSMAGTAYRTGEIFAGGAGFPSLVDAYAKVPVLAEQYPSQEVLLNAAPDFVTGNADTYTFGPTTERGTGFTREDMAAQGIKTYTFLCEGETATTDLLLTRFEEFGRIFGKGEEARALVEQVRNSLAATEAVLAGATPVKTFWYSSGTGPLRTYGGGGQFANGLKQSGGQGIFDELPSFPTPEVTAEQVIARNPDAIIIVDEGRLGGSDAPDVAAKKDFLVSTLGPGVNAIRNDRFCYIDFLGFSTGPRLAATVASTASCLHPELDFN